MWWMGVFYGALPRRAPGRGLEHVHRPPQDPPVRLHRGRLMAILAPATLGAVFGVLGAKAFCAGPFTAVMMVASAFLAGTALLGIVFYVVHRFQPRGLRARRAGRAAVGPAAADRRPRRRRRPAGPPGRRRARQRRSAGCARRRSRWSAARWPRCSGSRVLGWAHGPGRPAHPARSSRQPAAIGAASALVLLGRGPRPLHVRDGRPDRPDHRRRRDGVLPLRELRADPGRDRDHAGAAAFMALGYTLAERYLDMGEGDTHVFFPFPWIKHDGRRGRTTPARRAAGAGDPGARAGRRGARPMARARRRAAALVAGAAS